MTWQSIGLKILTAVLVSSQSVLAAELGDLFNETVYVCTIISFTNTGDDMDVSFRWSSLDDQGASHGGNERSFKKVPTRLLPLETTLGWEWLGGALERKSLRPSVWFLIAIRLLGSCW